VTIDTGFAMAYRKLAVEYGNRGLAERSQAYYEKAYAHIDRLSDAERYLLLGSYYQNGKHQDAAKARAAFERLLEIQPTNTAGLNNLATLLIFDHEYARAESLLVRAIQVGPVSSVHYHNLMRVRLALGKSDSARAAVDSCARAFPKNSDCVVMRADLQWALGEFDSVRVTVAAMEPTMSSPEDRANFAMGSAAFMRLQGRLDEANRFEKERTEQARRAGALAPELDEALSLGFNDTWFRNDAAGAVHRMDDALARTPLRSMPMSEAPYVNAVLTYAAADRVDRARAILAEWDARRSTAPTTGDSIELHRMRGNIALAVKDYPTAESELRITENQGCAVCDLAMLGRAYDLGGAPDSAIAVYERYVSTPWAERMQLDGWFLPAVHKRLGERYEANGHRDAALKHYRAFLALWKNADPVLQPKVRDAQQRVAALTKGADSR
jgi:tetratricopeptide (TPR) repeat protein